MILIDAAPPRSAQIGPGRGPGSARGAPELLLFFWHGAERIFPTVKVMCAGNLLFLRLATYGAAAVLTLATLALLLAVGF